MGGYTEILGIKSGLKIIYLPGEVQHQLDQFIFTVETEKNRRIVEVLVDGCECDFRFALVHRGGEWRIDSLHDVSPFLTPARPGGTGPAPRWAFRRPVPGRTGTGRA